MASRAGCVAAPPADPRLVMPASVSVQAQSGVSSVRPQSEADTIVNALVPGLALNGHGTHRPR